MKTKYFLTDLYLNIVIKAFIVHSLALCGGYLIITGQVLLPTVIFHFSLFYLSVIGMTCGAHRLWSHRSYKAKGAVEVVLMVLQTYSGQCSAYEWALDHRVHHKFVDTDADPYNIKRGLFFAQFGWICMKKTELFDRKAETIDVSDLTGDRLVMFQHNHFEKVRLALWSGAALVPLLLWDESLVGSVTTLLMCYVIEAHQSMSINSLAHKFGLRPYDTSIEPTFNRFVSYLTLGEGYHNFHHTFPKDYSQCELKWNTNFNISAVLIDVCESMGWVTDKHVVDPQLIAKRRHRTGDPSLTIASLGSHFGCLIDYTVGLTVFTWALWLVLILRLFSSG